ncbi:MAG: LamG-like jellyroll fold domain-containing protein [Planctomycetota bacterium]|jgi:hypothetical protein
MKKKLILLMSIVFVLGLVLTSQTKAADPAAALIGYWKLDGDTLDSSGLENHGTTQGNPIFEAGKFKEAMYFDGNGDYLRIDSVADDFTNDDLTLSAWIKTADTGSWQWWFSGNTAAGGNVIVVGLVNGAITVHTASLQITSTTIVNDLEWRHVAYSRIGSVGSLYINGVLEGTHTPSFNVSSDNLWSIGQEYDAGPTAGDFLDGTVDDVRIYDRGLTAEELPLIMTTLPPGAASEPSPEDEATDVPRDVVLNWTPGKFAPALNGHKLYLSESFDDVNDSVGGITLSSNSYTPPQRLDFETVYYWRVNEVNAPPDSTVFPGEVWGFTTEPVGYPIDGVNITATASSQAPQADVGPEKTIDGSGLDENDLHSAEPTEMWLSDSEPSGAWIQYEFRDVYKLHQMWVWNSNQPFENLFLGFGFRDVTVEYSTDGTNWTALADVPEFTRAPGADGYAHDTTIDFGGVVAKYVKLTATSNWSGVMPQFGLSEVRFLYVPLRPREPYPASGAADIPIDVTLGWRAGRESAEHEVSFSSNEQAVIDGTAPVTTVTEAAHGPLSLDLGQTYYWQIVEVNNVETPVKWQGNVLGFMTEKYIVVDDFELYNDIPAGELDSNLVYMSWVDGFDNPNLNGSTMGYVTGASMEADNVHSGRLSVPMEYNNTTAPVSEVTASLTDLPVGSVWTKHSIRTLSLWFSGAASNTGLLYVKINGSKVVYDGDPTDLQRGWQVWNIELASFGVDLQNVTTISIGVEGANATGVLLLDDIRLYPFGRQLVTPAEPGTTGLIGYWKLDGDALDYSGLANDGVPMGDWTYEIGKTGQAIKFDGFEDYVTIDGVADDITNNDITLSAWVKTADTGSVYWFSCNSSTGGNVALLGILGGRFAMYDVNTAEGHSRTLVNDLEWHHLAYTRIGDIGSLYVDGVLEGTHTANFNYSADDLWSIGQEWDAGPTASNFLTGSVDDVRIYDAGLSYAEIAALAGRTLPFDKPF